MNDLNAIRAQMEALEGFTRGPWKVSPTDYTTVITHDRNIVAEIDGDYNEPDLWPIMEANARLIAAAPDMHATILSLCDEVARLVEAARAFASWDQCWPGNINLETACRDIRSAIAAMETNHDQL